ncbi:glycosyl hydrolase family 28 protein [Chitinophaga sp. CC14]|uniref:glycosyl hydrolase family 28 protein n=1 Tax=Chitinophaga sp. CC14 TaxID=3029199 RepID=UPI003B7A6601
MNTIKGKILFLFAVACCFYADAQELVTYPAPKAVIYSMHNDDYTVRVRKPGGEWQDLFEYNVKVDLDNVKDASMVYFDCSGTVEVSVRKNNMNVQSVKVRPLSYGIKPVVNGNTITFSISQPRKISVEFNGDTRSNLHVFANPIETNKPDSADPNVVYFGPGVHTADSVTKTYKIASGKTVYIAGGAIVRGAFLCDKVKQVKIIGRGIIDQAPEGVLIKYSDYVELDGIIVVNPKHYSVTGGESKHLTIRNLKSFSSRGWGDGIDLFCCEDVVIDDVFMRNSDDCIAIYGHRWDYYGNVRNCAITNSTLWADIAHPINIGLHGNTNAAGDTIEHILFKNIDILEQDEDDPDYEGCMAISNGDLNLVRNIRFEDIRVEDFEEGQLLNLRVVFNKKYNTGPGRGIENILFKNISYNGSNSSLSVIHGLDKDHRIKGVTFENLRINGKLVMDADSGRIKVGGFVEGLTFKK